jgi:hypothetical protein
MNAKWDASLIADTVSKYVVDYNISIVHALFNTRRLIADILFLLSVDPDL